jgi:3-deoxy-D-manno-octulosonic-acid transferase
VALRAARPDIRILLVPRYPGKTPGEVLSAALGPDLRIIDSIDELDTAGLLVWLEQMGTLAAAYARATVGVVCGTFSAVGGHDLSEPLHLGGASVYGPHIERQKPLHEALSALGCATQVQDAGELSAIVAGLLKDKPRRDQMIAAFRQVSDIAATRLDRLAEELVARLR